MVTTAGGSGRFACTEKSDFSGKMSWKVVTARPAESVAVSVIRVPNGVVGLGHRRNGELARRDPGRGSDEWVGVGVVMEVNLPRQACGRELSVFRVDGAAIEPYGVPRPVGCAGRRVGVDVGNGRLVGGDRKDRRSARGHPQAVRNENAISGPIQAERRVAHHERRVRCAWDVGESAVVGDLPLVRERGSCPRRSRRTRLAGRWKQARPRDRPRWRAGPRKRRRSGAPSRCRSQARPPHLRRARCSRGAVGPELDVHREGRVSREDLHIRRVVGVNHADLAAAELGEEVPLWYRLGNGVAPLLLLKAPPVIAHPCEWE